MIKESPKNKSLATATRLYRYITDEGFKPGDRLPVRQELERQTGIGPRRLREGLSVLEHHGLVETRNKGGTIVRSPSPESFAEPFQWQLEMEGTSREDLMRARASLEGAVAFEAAMRRTTRDLLVILDALENLEAKEASRQADWQEEKAFHLAVLAATHNPALKAVERIILACLKDDELSGPVLTDMHESNRMHRMIFDAINDKQPTVAMQLMYEHLTGTNTPKK